MRYIESIFAAGRTISTLAKANPNCLHSTYCGSLIIKVYV